MIRKCIIKSYYHHNIIAAAKKSKPNIDGNDMYNYYNGRAHAYGHILGYEYTNIEDDIEAEIKALKGVHNATVEEEYLFNIEYASNYKNYIERNSGFFSR